MKAGDTMVLDWSNVDPEADLADFPLVTVLEVVSQAKVRVRADRLVLTRTARRVEPREPFVVRRTDLRPYVPNVEVLTDPYAPTQPTWRMSYVTVDCQDERHRVQLCADGQVKLPDHSPEHFALSAITGAWAPCQSMKYSVEECLVFGTGIDGIGLQHMRLKTLELSTWFAYNMLRRVRFTRSMMDAPNPTVRIVADTCADARRAAKKAGRLMGALRSEPTSLRKELDVALAVSDVLGNVHFNHVKLSGRKAEQMARSRASTVASSVGSNANVAYWAFQQPIAYANKDVLQAKQTRAVCLWNLLRLAELADARYVQDDPIVRRVFELRGAIDGPHVKQPSFVGALP